SSPMMFGGYIIPKYPPDGGWHRFAPNGDELGLSFDPAYHGPPVDGNRPLSQFDPDSNQPYGHIDDDQGAHGPYDRDPHAGNALDDLDDWFDRRGPAGVMHARRGRPL